MGPYLAVDHAYFFGRGSQTVLRMGDEIGGGGRPVDGVEPVEALGRQRDEALRMREAQRDEPRGVVPVDSVDEGAGGGEELDARAGGRERGVGPDERDRLGGVERERCEGKAQRQSGTLHSPETPHTQWSSQPRAHDAVRPQIRDRPAHPVELLLAVERIAHRVPVRTVRCQRACHSDSWCCFVVCGDRCESQYTTRSVARYPITRAPKTHRIASPPTDASYTNTTIPLRASRTQSAIPRQDSPRQEIKLAVLRPPKLQKDET